MRELDRAAKNNSEGLLPLLPHNFACILHALYLYDTINITGYEGGILMPTLQVRNVPENIYRRIVNLAELERRSIAQETLSLLESALNMDNNNKSHREKLIDCILHENENSYSVSVPDPVPLIREDRER
jgi:hypothetical protein